MRNQIRTLGKDFVDFIVEYAINKYDQHSVRTLSGPWFRIVNWLSVYCFLVY